MGKVVDVQCNEFVQIETAINFLAIALLQKKIYNTYTQEETINKLSRVVHAQMPPTNTLRSCLFAIVINDTSYATNLSHITL